MALDAVYTWAYAIEEKASSPRLRAYARRNGLTDAMTKEDLEVFELPRGKAQRDFGETVGWALENMWPLAWILGFSPSPPVSDQEISESVANRLIMEFMPNLDGTVKELVDKAKIRSVQEVAAMYDIYYCAHNAIRNATLGQATVPPGFDIEEGGMVIQERRHAFGWSLSPGVAWDKVDLST